MLLAQVQHAQGTYATALLVCLGMEIVAASSFCRAPQSDAVPPLSEASPAPSQFSLEVTGPPPNSSSGALTAVSSCAVEPPALL